MTMSVEDCTKAIHGTTVYHPNAASDIVAQTCSVPVYTEGDTGQGKTSTWAALAKAIEYEFLDKNCALHEPSEFGGIPFPDFNRGVTVVLPMEWTQRVTKPKCLLFFDELPCLSQETRPVVLKALSERILGVQKFADDLICCAAGNPSEMSPNGTPLERSLCNRFYHHKWVAPIASWLKGMDNDCNFEGYANVPILPKTWLTFRPKWSGLIASYCRSSGNYESKYDPDNPGDPAFATLRSWRNLALGLAAAESVNAEPEIYHQIATGLVGRDMASMFLEDVSLKELIDPEGVLNGTATVDFKARLDILHCLPSAIIRCLQAKDGMSLDRYDRAAQFFASMASTHADLILSPLGHFVDLQPEGYAFSPEYCSKIQAMFTKTHN